MTRGLLVSASIVLLVAACTSAAAPPSVSPTPSFLIPPEPTPRQSGQPASTLPAPTPIPPGPDLQLAGLVDARDGWALTSTGLFITADGGASWRVALVPGPHTGRGVLGVDFIDARRGWLATLDSADWTSNVFDVWRTEDGARTWQKAVVPEGVNRSDTMGPVEFSFLGPDRLFMLVEGGMPDGWVSDLYESTDGGQTWSTDRPSDARGASGSLAFATVEDGVIAGGAGDNRLFVTSDGGRSWRLAAIPAPAGTDPTAARVGGAVRFWNATTGAVTVGYGTETGPTELGIIITDDAGASWSLGATVPSQGGEVSISLTSPKDWVAMPDAGTVLRTADAGRSWAKASARGLAGAPWSLDFPDGAHGWALVPFSVCLHFKSDCSSRTGLYATDDGGLTWRALWPR